MEEQRLIERARDGDTAAIQALYRLHASRVYSVVRRLAGDDALAEDWAQEAWVRAIRSIREFRGDSRFATWLHRIAVNCALQGRRGFARRNVREAQLSEVAIPPPDRDALLRRRLERAIERLPEGMRRVLVLHDVEGYTHQEIAEMLGVQEGTCKSQLFKARARMRVLLAEGAGHWKGAEVCNT